MYNLPQLQLEKPSIRSQPASPGHKPKLNSISRLTSNISTAVLSACAGLLAFGLWRLGFLSFDFALPILSTSETQLLTEPLPEIAAVVILLSSLAIGFYVRRAGLRNCYLHLLGLFVVLLVAQWIASQFFRLDFLFNPLLFAGISSVALVQLESLRELDRKLTGMLWQSTRGVKNGEASARLTSGLRLLSVVLPLTEAVVFQCGNALDFIPVARLKGGTTSVDDSTRNSVWRGGVKLCERAFSSRDLVIDTSNQSGPTVAVPLEYQQEITGVLLVRLRSELCNEDRSLLNAVAAQFARNLARDTFSKAPFDSSFFSFFSAQTGEKKIEAMDVMRAGVIEQQSQANALTQMHDGVAIAYLDGTLALINEPMQWFAGIKPEQSQNLDLFALLDRFRTDVFDEPAIAIRRVLQTGDAYEGELNFDERGQILGLRISLLIQDTIEPVGLAIFVRDLTSHKEYEKLKSDMISLMSHELRTPLTSINGFAEVLSADDTIPEPAKEFVGIIANESQRMSRMINTFLSVTQLQRKDKQEVLKIPLRLDEVVRDTIASLQPVAKKKRIRLVEQLPHRIPPVAADKSLITQAVKNLLHNAIKYSPERTTVTVSTALEAEAVRVSVEDRGFGIPAESRDRVWEKFYRVVREGQEKDEESTGLGLAFVREVIEQHGGSVGVDSEEGRGSKFSFTLPRL